MSTWGWSARLNGPSFPGDWRSYELHWRCNTASLLTTVAWLPLGSISETHTEVRWGWHIRHTYKSHVGVCHGVTVRFCMMSCSRAELAISWLWSGVCVCCSNINRICPSWGSSASFRSLTCISCRSVRSRRGTALNADTQAPLIASLEVVDRLILIPDMWARDHSQAEISEAKKCHTPFVVGFLR